MEMPQENERVCLALITAVHSMLEVAGFQNVKLCKDVESVHAGTHSFLNVAVWPVASPRPSYEDFRTITKFCSASTSLSIQSLYI